MPAVLHQMQEAGLDHKQYEARVLKELKSGSDSARNSPTFSSSSNAAARQATPKSFSSRKSPVQVVEESGDEEKQQTTDDEATTAAKNESVQVSPSLYAVADGRRPLSGARNGDGDVLDSVMQALVSLLERNNELLPQGGTPRLSPTALGQRSSTNFKDASDDNLLNMSEETLAANLLLKSKNNRKAPKKTDLKNKCSLVSIGNFQQHSDAFMAIKHDVLAMLEKYRPRENNAQQQILLCRPLIGALKKPPKTYVELDAQQQVLDQLQDLAFSWRKAARRKRSDIKSNDNIFSTAATAARSLPSKGDAFGIDINSSSNNSQHLHDEMLIRKSPDNFYNEITADDWCAAEAEQFSRRRRSSGSSESETDADGED